MNRQHALHAGCFASALLGITIAANAGVGDPEPDDIATFHAPVRMQVDGTPVDVEAPGYASPAWHDVNGDGRADLVVGQFADGKIRVFTSSEDGSLATGEWLQAGGKVAEVPGVW